MVADRIVATEILQISSSKIKGGQGKTDIRTNTLRLEGGHVIFKGKKLERVVVGGELCLDFFGLEGWIVFDGALDRHQDTDKCNGQK